MSANGSLNSMVETLLRLLGVTAKLEVGLDFIQEYGTEDEKAFLCHIATTGRIQNDDYVRLLAILRRMNTAVPAISKKLPYFATYKLCKLWGKASAKDTEIAWSYIQGWLDGIGDMHGAGDVGEDLTFLFCIACQRELMAWEAQP